MSAPQKRVPREERIRRAVRRKNKKLIDRNPLFADELRPGGDLESWLTNESKETARYDAIDEAWKDAQFSMRDLAEEQSDRALTWRDLIAEVVDVETMARLDTLPDWLASKQGSPGGAAYLCEYWYDHLRTYRHEKAVAYCHLDHEDERRWNYERCPRCRLPLERIMVPEQMVIGEKA